jgi:hypothetical protein
VTPEQIISLKQKLAGGATLLPDQETKVAREDAVRLSLLDLQQQHPEAAAAVASFTSVLKAETPKAAAVSKSGRMVQDVLECPVDEDMAGACTQQVCDHILQCSPRSLILPFFQCVEFDCRHHGGGMLLTSCPRISAVPLIFMRETHYIGRYHSEGIDFACPRLIIELPNCSTATPASLLAALASTDFAGFNDVRFTAELWDLPPSTPGGDFNIMTHAWMFGSLDLAQKLQNNADVIIGAFEPCGIQATPPAAPAAAAPRPARAAGGDNKQALPLNSVRRMRVSLHMKRGSPAFSPNNCKLRLQKWGGTPSFWLLKGDPATHRAVVSFICLLPHTSNAAFMSVMSQQRKIAGSAADALPGHTCLSLHTLLSCLHSQPSTADAAAALGACLVVSDDHASLCAAGRGSAASAGALVQLGSMTLGDAGGEGDAAQEPVVSLESIHAAIQSECVRSSFCCFETVLHAARVASVCFFVSCSDLPCRCRRI